MVWTIGPLPLATDGQAMADALRPKPAEYYNPRPLILGVCFFWGIAVGFFLFFFAPPKQSTDAQPARSDAAAAAPATMTEVERRRQDIPVIADVDLQREAAAPSARPRLETMDLDPPLGILTTEGGLNGKMARPLRSVPSGAPGAATAGGGTVRAPSSAGSARPPPAPVAPPPIPELLP